MSDLTRRMTIYLEPELYKTLRLKAATTGSSMSALVNELLREQFAEDAEDLQAFRERASEPVLTYKELLEELRQDGTI